LRSRLAISTGPARGAIRALVRKQTRKYLKAGTPVQDIPALVELDRRFVGWCTWPQEFLLRKIRGKPKTTMENLVGLFARKLSSPMNRCHLVGALGDQVPVGLDVLTRSDEPVLSHLSNSKQDLSKNTGLADMLPTGYLLYRSSEPANAGIFSRILFRAFASGADSRLRLPCDLRAIIYDALNFGQSLKQLLGVCLGHIYIWALNRS
jgi:hypothetical protein